MYFQSKYMYVCVYLIPTHLFETFLIEIMLYRVQAPRQCQGAARALCEARPRLHHAGSSNPTTGPGWAPRPQVGSSGGAELNKGQMLPGSEEWSVRSNPASSQGRRCSRCGSKRVPEWACVWQPAKINPPQILPLAKEYKISIST